VDERREKVAISRNQTTMIQKLVCRFCRGGRREFNGGNGMVRQGRKWWLSFCENGKIGKMDNSQELEICKFLWQVGLN
jgi:hypothetical protein